MANKNNNQHWKGGNEKIEVLAPLKWTLETIERGEGGRNNAESREKTAGLAMCAKAATTIQSALNLNRSSKASNQAEVVSKLSMLLVKKEDRGRHP